jgi:hypothetical protein
VLVEVFRFITYLFRLFLRLIRALFKKRPKQTTITSSVSAPRNNSGSTNQNKEDEQKKQIEQAILLHSITHEIKVPNEMYYFVQLYQPDFLQVAVPSEKMEIETVKFFNHWPLSKEVNTDQYRKKEPIATATIEEEKIVPQNSSPELNLNFDFSDLLYRLLNCFRYQTEEVKELPMTTLSEPKIILYSDVEEALLELETSEPIPSVTDASVVDSMPQPRN